MRTNKKAEIIKKNAVYGALIANFIVYFTSVGMTCGMLEMKSFLHIGLAPMEWTITLFTAFGASTMTLGGQYGDIFGRVKVLLFGVTMYFITCILMSIGLDVSLTIIGSIIRGIGAGFIVSGSLSLIKILSPPEQIKKISTIWVIVAFCGYLFGCIFGGLFAQFVDWRMLYWVCVIPLIYSIISLYLAIPIENFKNKKKTPLWKQIDYTGSVLLCIFAITIVFIFSKGNYWGWGSPTLIVLYVLCPLSIIFMLLSQLWIPHPLIEYKYCLRYKFITGILTQLACYATIYPMMFFINFYTQSPSGFDHGPLLGGVYLLPMFIAIVIFNFIAKAMIKCCPVYRVTLIGLIFLFAGVFSVYFFNANNSYLNLWWRLVIIGTGLGLCLPTAVISALEDIPHDHTGMASGVLNLMNYLGATLGVSIGSIAYSSQIKDQLNLLPKTFVLNSAEKLNLLSAIHGSDADLSKALSVFSITEKKELFELLHVGSSNGLAYVGLVCTVFAAIALFFKIIYKIKILKN